MKNTTTKNLIILGAIIFSFALTNSVSAYCKHYAFSNETVGDCIDEQAYLQNYYQQPQPGSYYNYSNNNNIYNPNPSNQTAKTGTSVVNNYYYPTTTKVATVTPVEKTITENTSIDRSTTNTDTGYNSGLGASAYNGYNYNGYGQSNGSEITALSFRGSGSFMPSSIWQWILVVILILAIIVLSRMFVKKQTVSQEIHTVHSH